jgi:D-lactate dehydrogenase
MRISEVRSIMHNSTLLGHPNVLVTPHIAFNSHEAIARINRVTVDNILGFLGGNPQNLVETKPSRPSCRKAVAPGR